MMLERHKASFNRARTAERAAEPRREREPARAGAGRLREPAPDLPPARGLDLPFDLRLRQQLLEDARPGPPARPARAPQAAGEAAIGRDLLVPGSWDILRGARPGQQHLLGALRARSDEVRRATDTLRTQLLQTLKANGWRRIAVCAPTAGAGTTFTALNLALSMASVPDVKTVLLDLNQRRPGLARALEAPAMQSVAGWLRGEVAFMDYLLRFSDNLAIGLTAEATEAPAEILQAGSAAQALDEMDEFLAPDVTICDLPPLLEHDDLLAFVPRVDAVLIVADATATTAEQIAECQRLLDGKVPFLGVVLNRGRAKRRRHRG